MSERPLGMADVGEAGVIRRVVCGDGLRAQLARLGLREGASIAVTGAPKDCLMVATGNASISLDRITAMSILIE